MPKTTPLIKRENTHRLGGQVVLFGEIFDEAYEEARRLEAAEGLVFVHPFEDDEVIAGQGTAAWELIDQAGPLDLILCPVGGGGLLAG